jgi:cyclopropane fatty-acyl-phospholipid synthase-like methyltransferase
MPEFDIKLYDREFFEWHRKHVRESSIRCMNWYLDKYDPQSIVDFGAGIGSYLESAYGRGIKIKGYEISKEAQMVTWYALWPYISYRDCTLPIETDKYDCVISFETAEHIEPEGTDQFILNLVNATGKTLLFTAAPPGQEGTGHINCQPKSFWLGEIGEFLTFNPEKTKEISEAWEKLGAPWYIVKNLLVFER